MKIPTKKRMGLLIIVVTIVAVVTVLLLIGQTSRPTDFTSDTTNIPITSPEQSVMNISTLPIPNENLTYSAWIPDWASTAGAQSLGTLASKLQIVSPVWYEVRNDGSLINKRPKNAKDISNRVKTNSGLLMPAIAMMDHEIMTLVLATQENVQRHVSAIISEVTINDYAGIDLDYESTKLSDKEAYFGFLRDLSAQLKQKNKKLIVTVLPKWGDEIVYPSLKETRQVQDWPLINEFADEIRIMAYDYTYSKADKPGPIAPLSWIKRVLDYAVQKLPREKIILGIHLYSYEWWQELPIKNTDPPDALEFTDDPDQNSSIRNRTTRSYTYNVVKTILQGYKGNSTDYEGEKVYRYLATNKQTGKKENRVLVYLDPAGVDARITLAKQYGIKGVSFWRLGDEQELLRQLP